MKFFILLSVFLSALAACGQDGAARFEALFERVDTNRDGKVSKEELGAAGQRSAWLEKADRNGDALVDRDELRRFFQRPEPGAQEKKTVAIEVVQSHPPEGEAPVTMEGIRAAEIYSADREGHSFLVMIDGKTVHESYANGWDRMAGHRLASGTKSFSGALLALAVKDGLLSLDEAVSATITGWKPDDRLRKITIRQLLNLTSGIEPGANGKVPSYAEATEVAALSGAGEAFRYGPNAFQIFGELLKRKLEAHEQVAPGDPLAYLEARVFDRIGLKYTRWRRDDDGNPHLPSGAFLTAPEWAKFGQLLLQKGEWDGEVLLNPETLAEAVRPQNDTTPEYGLTFWLLESGVDESRPWMKGSYMAAGAGKQRLFVLPAVGMVIVRQGESRKFENIEFLEALFSVDSSVAFVQDGE